jgi:hypothetical protein
VNIGYNTKVGHLKFKKNPKTLFPSSILYKVAAGGGLEPPQTAPEAAVLPLDDPAIKFIYLFFLIFLNLYYLLF